jgi:hypothetical protein
MNSQKKKPEPAKAETSEEYNGLCIVRKSLLSSGYKEQSPQVRAVDDLLKKHK